MDLLRFAAAVPLFAERHAWLVAFWISYWAWAGFELWVFSRDRRGKVGTKHDGGSLFVIFVLITLGMTVAFLAPHVAPFARIALPHGPVFFAAIVLIWSGLALRIWSIRTLGRFFRIAVEIQDGHRLVTTGPYRVLRHPAYAGFVLAVTGIGLAIGNWISLAALALCSLVAFSWRILHEERALRARFGAAFDEHRRRTWALVPFVW